MFSYCVYKCCFFFFSLCWIENSFYQFKQRNQRQHVVLTKYTCLCSSVIVTWFETDTNLSPQVKCLFPNTSLRSVKRLHRMKSKFVISTVFKSSCTYRKQHMDRSLRRVLDKPVLLGEQCISERP